MPAQFLDELVGEAILLRQEAEGERGRRIMGPGAEQRHEQVAAGRVGVQRLEAGAQAEKLGARQQDDVQGLHQHGGKLLVLPREEKEGVSEIIREVSRYRRQGKF